MTFVLWVATYLIVGYVLSMVYETRRRASQKICVESRMSNGVSRHQALYLCSKNSYSRTPHLHSDADVLWLVFAAWPGYAVALAARLTWGLARTVGTAISPARVVDKGEEIAVGLEKRREAREEAKKMTTLVKGKEGEMDG